MDYKELVSLRSQNSIQMPAKVELEKKVNSPTEDED